MTIISEDYVAQLRKLHNQRQWGASGYSHTPVVIAYYRLLRAKSVLDYGCGRATLKPELLKIDPTIDVREYDPAIEGKDNLPLAADLLVANDVLEHIEPEYLDQTLLTMRFLAIKGAYFTIALTPSKVDLPDGRNAHLVIKSREWWLKKLKDASFVIMKEQMRKGLWVWTI